jgi:hypothetical protein
LTGIAPFEREGKGPKPLILGVEPADTRVVKVSRCLRCRKPIIGRINRDESSDGGRPGEVVTGSSNHVDCDAASREVVVQYVDSAQVPAAVGEVITEHGIDYIVTNSELRSGARTKIIDCWFVLAVPLVAATSRADR